MSLATAACYSLQVASPVRAESLPASYQAAAHGDLLRVSNVSVLQAVLPGGGSLAEAVVGHSRATADSTRDSANTVAESANLDASLLFGAAPIPVDSVRATAPASSGPTSRALVAVPLLPLVTGAAIGGTVWARYGDANTCVPADHGRRLLSESITTLAATSVVPTAIPGIGSLAEVGVSTQSTATALVDDGTGGSDVEAVITTTVGDVSLLGGKVTVHVTSPVVLRAHSDGTTGSASVDDLPTVTAAVGGNPAAVPLNGQPQTISVSLPDNPSLGVDLKVTAFSPTDSSSGATGAADLQALVRIDLTLTLAGAPVTDAHLSLAPMHVNATAPRGGVECAAAEDPDGDGLTNAREDQLGTDPTDPDTDRDGLDDGQEVWSADSSCATNALVKDTDRDGLTDGQEVNGVRLGKQVVKKRGTTTVGRVRTRPCDADTDNDGLTDGQEVHGVHVNQKVLLENGSYRLRVLYADPRVKDTDADGLRDKAEVTGSANRAHQHHRSNPMHWDTDRGGVSDGGEVDAGSDPSNWHSGPRHPRG